MISLSEHFTLGEATQSSIAARRGINNLPLPRVLATMMSTAQEFEKVRIALGGTALHIDSWYRCPELNTLVGSQPTSQHMVGEAIDFTSPVLTPIQICQKLIDEVAFIHYDQLILEHTWVHISFAILTQKPRHQVLSLLANKQYAIGLTDINGIPIEANKK